MPPNTVEFRTTHEILLQKKIKPNLTKPVGLIVILLESQGLE